MVVGIGLSCKPITLLLYSNFQIFVTVVTKVGLRQITVGSYIRWPPNSPRLFGQELRTYLLYQTSYGEFCGKIFKFSLSLQQRSSEQSSTDSIKLSDLENPLVGTSIWRYQLHKLSYSRFCAEYRKFSLPWQKGSVRAKCDCHS